MPNLGRSDANLLTISEVASQFGVTLRALRFYEDRALLSPQRVGHHRFYDASSVERVAFILKMRDLGFTLVEIRELLRKRAELSDGGTLLSSEQLSAQIGHLERERARLEAAIVVLKTEFNVEMPYAHH